MVALKEFTQTATTQLILKETQYSNLINLSHQHNYRVPCSLNGYQCNQIIIFFFFNCDTFSKVKRRERGVTGAASDAHGDADGRLPYPLFTVACQLILQVLGLQLELGPLLDLLLALSR